MSYLLDSFIRKDKCISVTGLGYVGLPLALEFSKHFKVIGFVTPIGGLLLILGWSVLLFHFLKKKTLK